MYLDGLTEEQCQLLDKMWCLDSVEDLEVWMRTLTASQMAQVRVLRELLFLSVIDDEVSEMKSFPDARMLLNSIMK